MKTYPKTPVWYVKDIVAMEQVMRCGLEENIAHVIPNDFKWICGRTPETFYHYLTYRNRNPEVTITTSRNDVELYQV
jgi:hypothetical protein